ncbi:MAG: hypothetical protein AAGA77_21685 [Bacteroidota bacterium]
MLPILGFAIIISSFLITPYISEFAIVLFPGKADGWQLVFTFIILFLLMYSARFALTKASKTFSLFTLVSSGIILGIRLFSENPFFAVLFILLTLVFLYITYINNSLLTKLQIEATSGYVLHKDLPDAFWHSSYLNTTLPDRSRIKAFKNIKNEAFRTDAILRLSSLKDKNEASAKTPNENANDPLLTSNKTLDLVKTWENRIQLLPILPPEDVEKCLVQCEDTDFLMSLINHNVIKITKRNSSSHLISTSTNRFCNKINSLWK